MSIAAGARGRRVDAAAPAGTTRCSRSSPPRALPDARVAAATCAVPSSCWRRCWLALRAVDTYYDLGFSRMQLPMPGKRLVAVPAICLSHLHARLLARRRRAHVIGSSRCIAGLPARCTCCSASRQAGENYWDAVGDPRSSRSSVSKSFASCRGFRWGILAGALALDAYLSGPGHVFIGRGLSEITSAGFLYLSALCVIAAQRAAIRRGCLMAAPGVFGVLGAWTRTEQPADGAGGLRSLRGRCETPAS